MKGKKDRFSLLASSTVLRGGATPIVTGSSRPKRTEIASDGEEKERMEEENSCRFAHNCPSIENNFSKWPLMNGLSLCFFFRKKKVARSV